jgi:hypothetical protein
VSGESSVKAVRKIGNNLWVLRTSLTGCLKNKFFLQRFITYYLGTYMYKRFT